MQSGALSTFLREALTPVGAPPASPRRLRLALLIHLSLALPFVLGPTGWAYATSPLYTARPDVVFVVWRLWMPMTVAFAVASALGVALPVREPGSAVHRGQQLAMWTVAALAIGTNQVSAWVFGTLASPAAVLVIVLMATYRVFLDYPTALLVAVLGAGGYAGVGLLELAGVVPAEPLSAAPGAHPSYANPDVARLMIQAGPVSVFLAFAAINYGVNQSVKLHRYLTRSVLQRYLPPELVERAARGEFDVEGAPERMVVTVMFTDLVGFTSLSERLGAEAVGALLNRYLGGVADLAHAHGATVDKFVGDAVMVVFGAPVPMSPEEQARRAVALARAIQAFVPSLGAEEPLSARSGVQTGEVVVGNFGSARRSDYTAIGPTVNVAARLEAASRPGRVLLGDATARLLDIPLEDAGRLLLKGVSEPVQAWFLPTRGTRGSGSNHSADC